MRSRLTCFFSLPLCLLMWSSALLAGCVAERHLVGDTSDAGTSAGTGGLSKGGGVPTGQSGTGGSGGAAASPPGADGVAGSGGSGGQASGTGAAAGGSIGVGGGGGLGIVGGPGSVGPATSTTPRPLPLGARKAVTAVSRLLWQTAPDASLLAMADSGAVSTNEDLRKLALRMLIDARAQVGVGDFYRWWLELDQVAALSATGSKDPILFPEFNADLAAAMASETQTFGTSVTLDGDGLFSTLLTAPFTFVNQALAGIYKLDGVTGTALRRVALDPTERAGLLTQSGLLALNAYPTQTSAVKRGYFWDDKVLCSTPPPPPANVPPLPTPAPTSATMRQLLEAHRANPACASCHGLMDPVGFTLEDFDAIGQFRATENGLPIDTSATITFGFSGRVVTVDGAPMLATVLATAPEARACMVQQWVAYAVNRPLTDQDNAALVDVQGAFSASGYNLRDLIAAVTQTDLFLTSTPTCTPGLDSTCNDNPTVNSIRGHCSEAARCVCPLYTLNPATGRCY